MHAQDAIRRIRRQADRLRTIDVIDSRAPAFMRWFRETSAVFEEIFGTGKGPSREFQLAIFQPLTVSKYDPDFDYRNAYEKGVPIAFSFFDSVVKDLVAGKFGLESEPAAAPADTAAKAAAPSVRVLVLPGSDEDAGAVLSRYLEGVGAAPSVAAEPSPGVSPVGKLKDASDFAIVVLAPSPREGGGGARRKGASGSLRPSPARMFELGYLVGRLGAKKVCALLPEGVELPFEVPGAAVVAFDGAGVWTSGLAKALESAGISA